MLSYAHVSWHMLTYTDRSFQDLFVKELSKCLGIIDKDEPVLNFERVVRNCSEAFDTFADAFSGNVTTSEVCRTFKNPPLDGCQADKVTRVSCTSRIRMSTPSGLG